jgi:hypothetical protein
MAMRPQRLSDLQRALHIPPHPGMPFPLAAKPWWKRPSAWCGCAAVLALLAAGAGALIFQPWPQTPATKPQPALRAPIITQALCDVSDPLEPAQADDARRILGEELPSGMRAGDHLLVAQLTDSVEAPLLILFNRRVPVGPEDCGIWDCTETVAKRQRDEFLAEYARAIKRCLEPGFRRVSPIAEALKRASVHPDFAHVAPGTQRRTILLSDGIQHAPGRASLYEREQVIVAKNPGGKKTIRQGGYTLYTPAGRRYIASHRALLQDVEVRVLLIIRPGESARQDFRAQEWLETHLTDCGARPPVAIRKLW